VLYVAAAFAVMRAVNRLLSAMISVALVNHGPVNLVLGSRLLD
jgi:hypothetical protein